MTKTKSIPLNLDGTFPIRYEKQETVTTSTGLYNDIPLAAVKVPFKKQVREFLELLSAFYIFGAAIIFTLTWLIPLLVKYFQFILKP